MPAPGQALLDRSADAPPARTLLDVLRATTVRHPEASAIDDGSGALSYRELMARVGATAARLHEAGVRRGDRVGVRMPSGSKELYISILGILAALILTFAFHGTDQASASTGVEYSSTQVFGFLCLFGIPVGIALGGAVALLLDRTVGRRTRDVRVDVEHVTTPEG